MEQLGEGLRGEGRSDYRATFVFVSTALCLMTCGILESHGPSFQLLSLLLSPIQLTQYGK